MSRTWHRHRLGGKNNALGIVIRHSLGLETREVYTNGFGTPDKLSRVNI